MRIRGRGRVLLVSLLVLILSIISATFTLLAATSKTWATLAYHYSPDQSANGIYDVAPVCIYERSPFYRCGLPQVNSTGHCIIQDCAFYKASGHNQTSCRSPSEYGLSWVENLYAQGLLGRSQECQQVHYAGNLQIAACFFLVLALLLALILCLATVASIDVGAGDTKMTHTTVTSEHDEPKAGPDTVKSADSSSAHVPSNLDDRKGRKRSILVPYLVLAMLICLYAGTLTQLLAQYFGVLGLTVNATPKDTVDAKYYVLTKEVRYFETDTWIVGKGLSTYATVAWAAALTCAAVSTAVFRTPRYPKLV